MNKKEFTALLPIKIQDLISLISEKERLSFIDSLHYLYESRLYRHLSKEESKIWHLSTLKLYLMLRKEKITEVLEFPDCV